MDLTFLSKKPTEGAKLLFSQSSSWSNTDLWNLFDFLLWEYQNDSATLFEWYRELMSCGQGFANAFITGHKFVCAATIKEGDPIYRCKTCQMDGTNLLCVECFKNSDHTGHDWTPTFTPGSGCCDCGDPESWDTKGFCSHHPGPNAGENIKIDGNLERVARLLCGYVTFILSHSLSPHHFDVLYLSQAVADKAQYQTSAKAAKRNCNNVATSMNTSSSSSASSAGVASTENKTTSKQRKKSTGSSGGMFGKFFNFGNEDEDEDDEDEEDNEDNDNVVSKDDVATDDVEDHVMTDHSSNANDQNETRGGNGIIERYHAFMKLLTAHADNGNGDTEEILVVKSQPFKPDGTDQKEPGEAENCGLGWQHPKDPATESLGCGDADAMEIAWKLRMYNQCAIASGSPKWLQYLAKKWTAFDVVNPEAPPYTTQFVKPDTLCRVITSDVLLRIIRELRDWSNNSEILKRIIASCLMLNVSELGPQCAGLAPIGKLSVTHYHYTDDVAMANNVQSAPAMTRVQENETAIHHLIINDHVLENDFNAPLIDLWFALVVIPAFKERVTQVFTACYGQMMQFWDFVNRQTQHCFVPLSVQFFTKKTTANVCESHRLIETLFDTHLLCACPKFVAAFRKHCDERTLGDDDAEVNVLQLFDPAHHKAEWTPHWMLSKKSTHCLYDIRYLLSIKDFMKYICFDSRSPPLEHFWKRLLHLLASYQHSKYQHRESGRAHIEMEDQSMVNVLRLDSTINGTNHRYLLFGLHELCVALRRENDAQRMQQALDMMLDAVWYGLTLIDKKAYTHFETHFGDDKNAPPKVVRMKLDNLDGGQLTCPYFRADRDEFTLTLNLSKTLTNIAKLYCDVDGVEFNTFVERLKAKYGDRLDDDDIFYWMDFSLRFISAFNQFHSDLLKKNGGVFATMIFNMEKPNFFSLFFSHNFYHIANHAANALSSSDFMTLLFHRHLLYDWFCDSSQHPIELFLRGAHPTVTDEQLRALCDPLQTGWKHWQDKHKVMKMVRNVLNELIAIISEPKYTLMLDDDDAHTTQVIRYELIQWLIFSKCGMGELEARVVVFGKINRLDIRPILNDIAIFEAPEAMNAGKFKLKPEFYREFNPYFRKYGKFNEYFGTADEQSEAIQNYIKCVKPKTTGSSAATTKVTVMFPNWPRTMRLSCDSQIRLLCTPFMGLIWNTILYHTYIDDRSRAQLTNFQQILRLIALALQSVLEQRIAMDSDDGRKLVQNFVRRFEFRLSEKWDVVDDGNQAELLRSDFVDTYREQAQNTFTQLTTTATSAEEVGIGSSVWFLCKMVNEADSDGAQQQNESNGADNGDASPKKKKTTLKHIGASQVLLMERILVTLHSLQIDAVAGVMNPLWSPPKADNHNDDDGGQKKKGQKKKLTEAEKKKRKAAKAREKMLKKMQQKNKTFEKQNETAIKGDEMREELEEKQAKESFGIGIKYACIVCRSRDNQDSISMMAFATKCCLLDRCLNSNSSSSSVAFNTSEQRTFDEIAFEQKGLNFNFCGHCVHKSCYDTYISQIESAHNTQQHYAGRGSINVLKKEFCCPYCKVVCNVLVPLQTVHRNDALKSAKTFAAAASTVQRQESTGGSEAMVYAPTALQQLHKPTAIHKKLCDEFFRSVFCIWDRHQHPTHQHETYVSDSLGATACTLSACHALSYSISCEEVNFRDLTKSSRKDRLNRTVSNLNAFIAALWSLAQTENDDAQPVVFDQRIIEQYSWDVIKTKVLNQKTDPQSSATSLAQNDADMTDKTGGGSAPAKEGDGDYAKVEVDERYCLDAFTLLTRGVISYPWTFTLQQQQQQHQGQNETDVLKTLRASSQVVMDMDQDNDAEDDDHKTNANAQSVESQVSQPPDAARDLYALLYCCYVMQFTQMAVAYACQKKLHQNDDLYNSVSLIVTDAEQKANLETFVTRRIVPFLRRCCLLYNALGCISSLTDLWSSSEKHLSDNEVFGECDALCELLQIPCVSDLLTSIASNGNFFCQHYISNLSSNAKQVDHVIAKHAQWDRGTPFSLIPLPSSYNDLFQMAAIAKCPTKQITPKYSVICLICGQYVCIDCCISGIIEQRGMVLRHCLECNNGFGAFLWLQKSKLIIVWNNLGVLFKSVYLDKYGEEDYGLQRGNRITLNQERYRQLMQMITQHQIPNKLVQLRKANNDLLERRLRL